MILFRLGVTKSGARCPKPRQGPRRRCTVAGLSADGFVPFLRDCNAQAHLIDADVIINAAILPTRSAIKAERSQKVPWAWGMPIEIQPRNRRTSRYSDSLGLLFSRRSPARWLDRRRHIFRTQRISDYVVVDCGEREGRSDFFTKILHPTSSPTLACDVCAGRSFSGSRSALQARCA